MFVKCLRACVCVCVCVGVHVCVCVYALRDIAETVECNDIFIVINRINIQMNVMLLVTYLCY